VSGDDVTRGAGSGDADTKPGAETDRGLHLFEAYGVELEHMIVDAGTLDVRPVADRLLAAVSDGDEPEAEVELGEIAWSNELVLHVIELKTNGPADTLAGLGALFQEHVARVGALLEPMGARLLPTGMHPWMSPDREARLWPHEYTEVYRTFDRIFGCRGHGWSNLQSTHVNLPFQGDDEFGRLHAAVRMVLPLLPALAASTPVADGRVSRWMDTRMETYRHNAAKVPSVAGRIVPERAFTRAEYDALLESVYADLAPHDPDGVLRHPWVNARGAIARFDRGSIEIRVIDSQECAGADVAVAAAAAGAVRALAEGRLGTAAEQRAWPEGRLAEILLSTTESADRAVIINADYLRCLGYPGPPPCTAGEVWRHLVAETVARDDAAAEWMPFLDGIATHGCLARRVLSALGRSGEPGTDVPREALRDVYGALADCIRDGEPFVP
jgi:gamma-glutamyl:cysteine ligase YbdK (ATP-grasp superfamily)